MDNRIHGEKKGATALWSFPLESFVIRTFFFDRETAEITWNWSCCQESEILWCLDSTWGGAFKPLAKQPPASRNLTPWIQIWEQTLRETLALENIVGWWWHWGSDVRAPSPQPPSHGMVTFKVRRQLVITSVPTSLSSEVVLLEAAAQVPWTYPSFSCHFSGANT